MLNAMVMDKEDPGTTMNEFEIKDQTKSDTLIKI